MPATECNCDLPDYAYVDWLQEQGWQVTEEDLLFVNMGTPRCVYDYGVDIAMGSSSQYGFGKNVQYYFLVDNINGDGCYVYNIEKLEGSGHGYEN
jgi:hypothetical protein